MSKVTIATDIEKTESLIQDLDELLTNRDDYQTNTGLQDIHDVLIQYHLLNR